MSSLILQSGSFSPAVIAWVLRAVSFCEPGVCICVSLKSSRNSSCNQQHPIPADLVLTYVCSDTFYSHCLGNSTNQELLPKGVFGLYVNLTLFPKFIIECSFEHVCRQLSAKNTNTVYAYSILNFNTFYKQYPQNCPNVATLGSGYVTMLAAGF